MSADEGTTYRESVPVRCAKCLDRHGVATALGEMLLGHSDQWTWLPHARLHQPAFGLSPSRRYRLRDGARAAVSGGVQIRCRRCGKETRTTVAALARRARIARGDALFL